MTAAALWWAFTLIASIAQTLRNAMQRELIGALGAVGAAQVRFLFGLPFAFLFVVIVRIFDRRIAAGADARRRSPGRRSAASRRSSPRR